MRCSHNTITVQFPAPLGIAEQQVLGTGALTHLQAQHHTYIHGCLKHWYSLSACQHTEWIPDLPSTPWVPYSLVALAWSLPRNIHTHPWYRHCLWSQLQVYGCDGHPCSWCFITPSSSNCFGDTHCSCPRGWQLKTPTRTPGANPEILLVPAAANTGWDTPTQLGSSSWQSVLIYLQVPSGAGMVSL